MTLTEKVLARTAGRDRVVPGEVEWAEPDLILMYDWPGFTDHYAKIMRDELKAAKIARPDRFVCFIDHMVPPTGEAEADFHHGTRRWAEEQGFRLYEGLGIGHQVAAELGLGRPGELIVHADTHVQVLGAFGALTLSLMQDLLTPLVLGRIWVEVPPTIKVELQGALQPGVTGRDVINRIIADLGPDGALGAVLEFSGEGVLNLGVDDRMSLLSEIVFCGAVTGVFPADAITLSHLKNRTGRDFAPIVSDTDASYRDVLTYDLGDIEPYVVAPSSPGNAIPLRDVVGTEVQQGYVGSCASGRLQDLEMAARILQNKKVREGFRLFIVPSSREVMLKASRSGALSTLIEAGAFVSSPSCDYCYGKTQSLSAGEKAVSTGTLNVPGRMGSIQAEIYLASAATVAATAVCGRISDPREYI